MLIIKYRLRASEKNHSNDIFFSLLAWTSWEYKKVCHAPLFNIGSVAQILAYAQQQR